MKIKNAMIMALVALSMVFVGCDKNNDEKPKDKVKKTKTIDATKYDVWTYINLETGDTVIRRDFSEWNYFLGMSKKKLVNNVPARGSETDIKIKWHIAIHRFDIKTNNAEAVATTEKDINKVKEIPTIGYEADKVVDNMVITDMSKMEKGLVGYASKSNLNKVLDGWLIKKPTGTMPPYEYKLSDLVYVVKFKDGSHAKLKFTDFTDKTGKIKGHVTFDYEFQPK